MSMRFHCPHSSPSIYRFCTHFFISCSCILYQSNRMVHCAMCLHQTRQPLSRMIDFEQIFISALPVTVGTNSPILLVLPSSLTNGEGQRQTHLPLWMHVNQLSNQGQAQPNEWKTPSPSDSQSHSLYGLYLSKPPPCTNSWALACGRTLAFAFTLAAER